ncbi:hypothetical protein BFP72_09380 [Reichenbachiella sp. 5M10]|uniref:hypothetical protein n=1 Tax=Reichenbachiella sp. 5M10 TaxID=1889772 RepID=UPI000C155747|nr:hypothetical protein [Reichenbachiella sp. 5M10]PIB35588.1 hypothetical protein BFP72_09380 [Reichenbachiella sp. 5M10]
MNVTTNREIERLAIHNIVKWVGEIDEREEILPLGNREEMMALLENAKGHELNNEERMIAAEMLVNSVVN